MITLSLGVAMCACSSRPVHPGTGAPISELVGIEREGGIEIQYPRTAVVEGGIFTVSVVSDEQVEGLEGQFKDAKVAFFPDHAPGTLPHRFTALVGVEYGIEEGDVPFTVTARVNGKKVEETVDIGVRKGEFRSETLRVPPRTVTPSKKDMVRIVKDRALILKAYSGSAAEKLWDSPALMPIQSIITSPYGSSRVYNGVKHNIHLGTDLRGPTGTPIRAPLTGRAVVARYLFYTGNTVILDHGYGLFTIYGHMSRLKVKEGQLVKKGRRIGLSGATGRSSGPHLHWGVNLHGVKVDPMVLFNLLKVEEKKVHVLAKEPQEN